MLAAAVAVGVSSAMAHIERASYFPNPAADGGVNPPPGAKVPDARGLYSALKKKPPGTTRVVCLGKAVSQKGVKRAKRRLRRARRKGATKRRVLAFKRRLRSARRSYRRRTNANPSIQELKRRIGSARKGGYFIRPNDKKQLGKKAARRLRRFNLRLLEKCRFNSIQAAVNASGNNDRVVIMPGLYTEPESRKEPTGDPKCADLREQNDKNSSTALSYPYQFKCPNDQNLIAVMGRRPGPGQDPQPPLWERDGIPNEGPCIRCNLQMEGSGVGPDDVVVEGGDASKGNGGPSSAGSAKDIGIRADRADGFVLRNVTVRHNHEHAIYVVESDGYRLERFKTFYPGEYGVLTFVSDHGLIQHCETKGAGDAGIYPGAAPETGEETKEGRQRYNQVLQFCDMHHNALGFSATDGNAIHVRHNNFFDNGVGLSTDVITAPGHPGFPTDTSLIEDNYFYSNNFNPFLPDSDVHPTIPPAVGTGMWILGGNNHLIRNNHFWDNWRRGAMLAGVPDSLVCGPARDGNQQKGCEEGKISTSHRNRFTGNTMSRTPDGKVDLNGVDFWWDEFAENFNNCWYHNVGRDATPSSITADPQGLPADCATSRGTSSAPKESELMHCLVNYTTDTQTCPWFTTPPEPKP